MKKYIPIMFLTGWLIPAGLALLFFGRWIVDIVVPTLKGGDFDHLYDVHQVRYLDVTLTCIVVAFSWLGVALFSWAKKQI